MFLVENGSDVKLLKIIAGHLGKSWNDDIVIWPTASGHKERKQLVLQIKDKIPQLTAISLVDRDNDNLLTTLKSLHDKDFPDLKENGRIILRYRKWRRRHIESYLICPQSIAAAANVTVETVSTFLEDKFSIKFTSPQSDPDDKIEGLFCKDCKNVLNQIEKHKDFKVSKYDIAQKMILDEICDDMKTLIDELSLL